MCKAKTVTLDVRELQEKNWAWTSEISSGCSMVTSAEIQGLKLLKLMLKAKTMWLDVRSVWEKV